MKKETLISLSNFFDKAGSVALISMCGLIIPAILYGIVFPDKKVVSVLFAIMFILCGIGILCVVLVLHFDKKNVEVREAWERYSDDVRREIKQNLSQERKIAYAIIPKDVPAEKFVDILCSLAPNGYVHFSEFEEPNIKINNLIGSVRAVISDEKNREDVEKTIEEVSKRLFCFPSGAEVHIENVVGELNIEVVPNVETSEKALTCVFADKSPFEDCF